MFKARLDNADKAQAAALLARFPIHVPREVIIQR